MVNPSLPARSATALELEAGPGRRGAWRGGVDAISAERQLLKFEENMQIICAEYAQKRSFGPKRPFKSLCYVGAA